MLFEQYAGRMMTICIRYSATHAEAEDMLQEAFIRIFSYIGQYKFFLPLPVFRKKIPSA
jgi:RNA polymerase sigma-70 factor (ECF subfamily)